MSELRPTIDLGYPTESRGKIPSFANIEEEAEFWVTHDSTDYLDDIEPIWPTRQQSEWRLIVSLSEEELRALDTAANEQGVDSPTLAQRWISERLKQVTWDQLQLPPEVEHGAAD